MLSNLLEIIIHELGIPTTRMEWECHMFANIFPVYSLFLSNWKMEIPCVLRTWRDGNPRTLSGFLPGNKNQLTCGFVMQNSWHRTVNTHHSRWFDVAPLLVYLFQRFAGKILRCLIAGKHWGAACLPGSALTCCMTHGQVKGRRMVVLVHLVFWIISISHI
jgi:hypothetical protein